MQFEFDTTIKTPIEIEKISDQVMKFIHPNLLREQVDEDYFHVLINTAIADGMSNGTYPSELTDHHMETIRNGLWNKWVEAQRAEIMANLPAEEVDAMDQERVARPLPHVTPVEQAVPVVTERHVRAISPSQICQTAGLGERQRTQECQIDRTAGLGEPQRTEGQVDGTAGLGEPQQTQECKIDRFVPPKRRVHPIDDAIGKVLGLHGVPMPNKAAVEIGLTCIADDISKQAEYLMNGDVVCIEILLNELREYSVPIIEHIEQTILNGTSPYGLEDVCDRSAASPVLACHLERLVNCHLTSLKTVTVDMVAALSRLVSQFKIL